MKSPFPGMDPYLEQHWGDVAHSFVVYAADDLQSRLPNKLRARMDEREFFERPKEFDDEPVTQVFIKIIDIAARRRIVTIVEFLIPPNKVEGAGREVYLHCRQDFEKAGVNIVEIDLMRGQQDSPYQVCVQPGSKSYQVEILPLQERLPVIAIPLRETDKDVALDLQAIIDDCYRKGVYGDDIEYTDEPNPPLSPKDAAWADELLRSKGLR